MTKTNILTQEQILARRERARFRSRECNRRRRKQDTIRLAANAKQLQYYHRTKKLKRSTNGGELGSLANETSLSENNPPSNVEESESSANETSVSETNPLSESDIPTDTSDLLIYI
jgi:hypothetical protein